VKTLLTGEAQSTW